MSRIERLMRLPSEVWGLIELSEDAVWEKIEAYRVGEYIRRAEEKACKYAENIQDIETVRNTLKQHGVLCTAERGRLDTGIHSQMIWEKNNSRIEIYNNVLEMICEGLKNENINIGLQKIYDVHIAHEFYHFLEFYTGEFIDRELPPVVMWKAGPVKKKRGVIRTREIAAHMFAWRICNIGFHPKVLDYVLLRQTDPVRAEKWYQSCVKAAERAGKINGNSIIWRQGDTCGGRL